MKTYQEIAKVFDAYLRCDETGNQEWREKHFTTLATLINRTAPSGSGWDNGTKLCFDKSNPEKLVFFGSFHHMDEGGGYDGWTDHSIIVKPSLIHGINITVTGRDRNDIKDYLAEMFDGWLNSEIEEKINA